MENITQNMTKTVSVSLKIEEYQTLLALQDKRIKTVEIFRHGLEFYRKLILVQDEK